MATDAVGEVKSAVSKVVGWLRWIVFIVLSVVLFLIVLRQLGVANQIVPNVGDANAWVYIAGMYWLIKG